MGRFSDRAVVERLRQLAPLNLVDGAWLQHIVTVGPADQVQANLFTIWNDEAGNGEAAQNHASLYDALLKSVNVHLPPMTFPTSSPSIRTPRRLSGRGVPASAPACSPVSSSPSCSA